MLKRMGGHRQLGAVASIAILAVGIGMASRVVCANEAPAAQPASDAAGVDSPSFDPPLRELWSRGDTRVLRQWLLLGPLPGSLQADQLASAGGEAAAHPAAGDPGSTQRWTAQAWGQEMLEMSAALNSRQYRGSAAAPEVGYAYRVLNRERDGDAIVSLGSDCGARIWVNGTLVRSSSTSDGFAFDHDRIPVHLNRGENRLLLKFEHRSGLCRFAARVLEPGTIVASRDELIPQIMVTGAGVLTVKAVSAHPPQRGGFPNGELKIAPPQRARVQILVTAAGGHTVARMVTVRDQSVQFPTAAWPDGAYEIHLVTQTVWGQSVTIHAPWYKGDAFAAARRLFAAAESSPNDTRGATLRMLASLVQDKVGGDLDHVPDDGWPRIHSSLLEYEELQQGTGRDRGPIHAGGFVRVAYVDETDGSSQFCRAYLPTHYAAGVRWPLVIDLHGFNPENPPYIRWWSVDERHNEIAERRDVIYVEPHGRGNTQYIGIGEQDVLHCLEEAKRRLSVDNDRVYLTGGSMGGEGVWLIASRHPELFAAAAPVFGGWDSRILHDPGIDNPRATTLPELYYREAQSSFAAADGFLNVPLYIHHGDDDNRVNVENSRHAARMLQRWGYDVRYREFPGRGHEELDNRDEIVEWFLTHRRVNASPRVRIRATDLDGAAAHWVRVTASEAPLDVIRVDAQVIEPGLIRLDTQNVAAVTLSPPPELRDGTRPTRVVWNGKEHVARFSADATTTLSVDNVVAAVREKRPGLQGGLSNIITTPFAIVTGTSSADPQMRRMCREKAEIFARIWEHWQHQKPRMFTDEQLTLQDRQRYSLLLIGGTDANLITRGIQPGIPLLVESDAITIDGRKFGATDAVVQMIYPSPANPARYVLVVAATSAAGMYFWNAGGLWNMPSGYPTQRMDWTIMDGRRVALEHGLGAERIRVASGIFDRHWRRDDRWVFPGDAALRAKSPLRRAPPPGFTVAPEILDSYPGRYELFPGFVVSVVRSESGLLAQSPAGSSGLTAEAQNAFGLDETDGVLTFDRDARGAVGSLTYTGEVGQLVGKRIGTGH